METDYWTKRPHERDSVIHLKLIGAGGFGDVYEVRFVDIAKLKT